MFGLFFTPIFYMVVCNPAEGKTEQANRDNIGRDPTLHGKALKQRADYQLQAQKG